MYRSKDEGYIFEFSDKGVKKRYSITSIVLLRTKKDPYKFKIMTSHNAATLTKLISLVSDEIDSIFEFHKAFVKQEEERLCGRVEEWPQELHKK